MFIHDALFRKVADPATMSILIYLISLADENGDIQTTYTDIAKALAYSRSRICRSIHKLEALHALCINNKTKARNNAETIVKRKRNEKSVITISNIHSYKITETAVKRKRNDSETQVCTKTQQKNTPRTTPTTRYFDNEKMNQAITTWLEYKKEKKQTYKPIGITRLKKKLLQMAAGDPDTMLAIVEDSIANNYAGLYDTRPATDPMNTGVILHNSPYHDPKEGGW